MRDFDPAETGEFARNLRGGGYRAGMTPHPTPWTAEIVTAGERHAAADRGASIVGKACRGPRRIEQCNITNGKFRDPVVLGQHRPAGDLKGGMIVVRAGEAGVPMRPLRAVSTATEVPSLRPRTQS
jgi:hypothetical protein